MKRNKDTNTSFERTLYLKKVKRKKYLVLITQIGILLILICIWEWAANKGIIDSFITSQPSKIAETFINLIQSDLIKHIGVTTYETIIGFLVGTIMGIIIAIILWWSEFLAKVSEPYLVVLNSLPKVALRTHNNYLGRCRNRSNNCNGNCYFINCYNIRKLKWIFKNR